MELERETVHAIAQAGRLRTVVKDVAEMAAAAPAMDFDALHSEGPVFVGPDGILERLIEARPAGGALEFRLGGEQRQIATGAGEGALAMLLEQRTGPWTFGAFFPQDFILLRGELGAPFLVGFFDLELFRGAGGFAAQPTQGGKAEQTGGGCKQDTAIDHGGLRAKRKGCVCCQIRTATVKVTCTE